MISYILQSNDHNNISNHTVTKFSFLVTRTCKIYFLATFKYTKRCAIQPQNISRTNLFYNWKFVPFNHFHPFYSFPTPCLWQPPNCSMSLIFFFFASTSKWDHTIFVFLWLISFSICFSILRASLALFACLPSSLSSTSQNLIILNFWV